MPLNSTQKSVQKPNLCFKGGHVPDFSTRCGNIVESAWVYTEKWYLEFIVAVISQNVPLNLGQVPKLILMGCILLAWVTVTTPGSCYVWPRNSPAHNHMLFLHFGFYSGLTHKI